MKYSQFNSIVPFNNQYALFNSFEKKVIMLEPELKELLEAGKRDGIDELSEIHPEFYDYLKEEYFLVDENVNEVQKVKEISKKIDNNPNMFFLIVNPTMNCNFKCWYCYETHIKKSRLEETVLDSVNKFITKTVSQKSIKSFILSFFGGEPLLYFNRNVTPMIDHLVEECKKYDTEFNIAFTTNGYLLNDEFINYFVDRNLEAGLQITFDGYGEEHDKVRFVNKTRGSYNEIVSNIKNLLKHDNFFVRARINYTHENIHNCFKIVDEFSYLSEEEKKKKLLFDFHRVWQDDEPDGTNIVADENAEKMKTKGFNTKVMYSINNVQDPCYADKRNSATINYNGDLYKCTARDFLPKNRVGYLTQDGDLVWENNHLERRMEAKFKNKPCLQCRLLPLCNGGCSQHAVEHIELGDEYCIYNSDDHEKDKVVLSKIEEIVNALA